MDPLDSGPSPAHLGERRPPRSVWLHVTEEFPAADIDALAQGLAADGRAVHVPPWYVPVQDCPSPEWITVLAAHHVVDPRRFSALMHTDSAHLPVVFTADTVEIGPLVTPGFSACLACVYAHRKDEDPSWPLRAATLLIGHPARVSGALACEAGLLGAYLIDTYSTPRPLSSEDVAPRPAITVRTGSLQRDAREYLPHEACGCRSPAGNGTVPAVVPPAPTRYAAFEQLA